MLIIYAGSNKNYYIHTIEIAEGCYKRYISIGFNNNKEMEFWNKTGMQYLNLYLKARFGDYNTLCSFLRHCENCNRPELGKFMRNIQDFLMLYYIKWCKKNKNPFEEIIL